jgi:hypothetical protein
MTMRRRRKWRAPNNPTGPAKQVWRAVYGEPWPRGWRVKWAGFMGSVGGMAIYRDRVILLSYGALRKPRDFGAVEALLHEFVHVRNQGMRHGAEFLELVNWARRQLGYPPKVGSARSA